MLYINGRHYATNDDELVDSLFNNGEGTLEKFVKIKHNKNESLFFITKDYGVAICKGKDNGGMLIKFNLIEYHGKLAPRFQYRINTEEEKHSAWLWFMNDFAVKNGMK